MFLIWKTNVNIPKQVLTYEKFYEDLINLRIEKIKIINDYFKWRNIDQIIIIKKDKSEYILHVSDLLDFMNNLESI